MGGVHERLSLAKEVKKKLLNSRPQKIGGSSLIIITRCFYGSISQEKYIFLMDYLESMIYTRFSQRNQEHSVV